MQDDRDYYRSTLDHGVAELYLPSRMSVDDVLDLERLLEIILRRLKRNAVSDVVVVERE